MEISKGLYEVITSKRITKQQKIEAVKLFSLPIKHLDGEHAGFIQPGEITAEDAALLAEAIRQDNITDLLQNSPEAKP